MSKGISYYSTAALLEMREKWRIPLGIRNEKEREVSRSELEQQSKNPFSYSAHLCATYA